jgi:esterase/lipase superfamily enzyme
MAARHVLLNSVHLGRPVHLWCFGERGTPVVVFPSNAGIAHEWKESGMVDALSPLLASGALKLYCPESNVSETFSAHGPLASRMQRHELYEQFVLNALVPFIREDCRGADMPLVATGCSMGALFTALFSLKFPHVFGRGLCLSGRYSGAGFTRGQPYDESLYLNDPLAFVPGLRGVALHHVQRTHLTLVVGQGAFENRCVPETLALAGWLRHKAVPHHLALWGHDARHDYTWWRKQAVHYLQQLV